MREVLTRNPGETDKDFFTRAAAVIAEYRKMGNEAAADACFSDIFPELYPIIVEMVECESARNRLDDETENEYYDRVMLLVPKIFHKYNNPEFTDEKYNDEQFKIKTFLKTRTRHCIREAVAKRLGITTWDAKYLLEIRRARMSIAKRKKLTRVKFL
ncbi:MAG: hypothetical protein K6F30_06380 [Lachnospiraceae bacterium]|nr:hypothetical protein [Lachnospiraceae bacterium]